MKVIDKSQEWLSLSDERDTERDKETPQTEMGISLDIEPPGDSLDFSHLQNTIIAH